MIWMVTHLGRGIVGLVAIVKFKMEAIVARISGADSTFIGLGHREIAFSKLAGCSVTTVWDLGLGLRSVLGSGSVAGSTYYFALWQNKSFDSYLDAYDVGS